MTQVVSHTPLALGDSALFLDFDGTLASFAPTPQEVEINPSIRALLREAVDKLDGRLAIVSGRTIEELDDLLQSTTPCIAGVHGLQRRRPDGTTDLTEPHSSLGDVGGVLDALAAARCGLLVERKPQSVAIHYRKAPDAQDALIECAERLAGSTGLVVQRGSMVVELRTPGPDKGAAVQAFMSEDGFRAATPIYIGDDLTDEPAFSEVMRMGGFGVLVGERRPTAAQYSLSSPLRVLDWLSASLERGSFDQGALKWVA